jgi:hypothetical protein
LQQWKVHGFHDPELDDDIAMELVVAFGDCRKALLDGCDWVEMLRRV